MNPITKILNDIPEFIVDEGNTDKGLQSFCSSIQAIKNKFVDFLNQPANSLDLNKIEIKEVGSLTFEKQKQLVQSLLNKIKLDNEFDIDFEELSFLPLEKICDLMLIKLFIIATQARPASNNTNESIEVNIFCRYLNRIVCQKKWIEKNDLIQSFDQFLAAIHIPSEIKNKLIKSITLVERCLKQKNCWSLPISNFGIAHKKSPVNSLHHLIKIQDQLFSIIKPNKFLKKINESIGNFLNEKNIELFQPLNSICSASLDNHHLLEKNLSVFVNNSKYRTEKAEQSYREILNLHPKDSNYLFYIDKAIYENPKIYQKILEITHNFKNFIDPIEDEISRFIVWNRKKRDEINIRQLCNEMQFSMSHYALGSALLFFELFSNYNKIPDIYLDPPEPEVFLPFFISLVKLRLNYSNLNNRKKEIKQINNLVNQHSKNLPVWYKEFLIKFSEKFYEINSLVDTKLKENLTNWSKTVKTQISKEIKTHKFLEIFLKELISIENHAAIEQKEKVFTSESSQANGSKMFAFCFTLLFVFFEYAQATKNIDDSKFQIWIKDFDFELKKTMGDNASLILTNYLENLRNLQSQIKSFQSCVSALNCTFPFLIECRNKIEKPQAQVNEIKSSWVFTIDKLPGQTSPKRKKTPLSLAQKGEVKLTSTAPKPSNPINNQRLKAEPSENLQLPNTPILQIVDSISQGQFYFPNKICQKTNLSEDKIFELDQIYHLHHVNWTLEMIEKSLKEKKYHHLKLLGANLINNLYTAQEQAITPKFLYNTDGKICHSLVTMNEALGKPCSENNDRGSIWYRYPHASKHLYQIRSKNIPLGLCTLLNEGDFQSTKKQVESILRLAEEGISNILDGMEKNENTHSIKISFSKKLEEIHKLSICTNDQKTVISNEFLPLFDKLNNLLNQLDSISDLENVDGSISDLKIHIARLIDAIALLEDFPEQRYLSLHERNIWIAGQYQTELAGIIISQLHHDELHTHDLQCYVDLFSLDKILSKDSLRLIEELNIKKGGDYIYWRFFKNKGKNPQGLNSLNDAYELSLSATTQGEGFIPASMKSYSATSHRAKLFELIGREITLIENLVNNKICNR